jgi:hypothetical protein
MTKIKDKTYNYLNKRSVSSKKYTHLAWPQKTNTSLQYSTCSAAPPVFLYKNSSRKTFLSKGFFWPGPCTRFWTTNNVTETYSTLGMKMALRQCSRKSGPKKLIMISSNSRNGKFSPSLLSRTTTISTPTIWNYSLRRESLSPFKTISKELPFFLVSKISSLKSYSWSKSIKSFFKNSLIKIPSRKGIILIYQRIDLVMTFENNT